MSIAKNTFYITGAFIFQKILSFFYIAFIAHEVGPALIGKYFFALAFTTVFSIFLDAGLTPVFIRESSQNKEKTNEYFNLLFTLKLIFCFFTILLIFFLINWLHYDPLTKELVYLAAVVMAFDSFSLTFYGALRARQKLKYEAIGIISYQIITVTLGVISLLTIHSVKVLIAILALSSFLNFLYSFYWARRCAKIKVSFSLFSRRRAIYLLAIAFPFFLAGVFNRVYTHIDTILLSKLAGAVYVGWYGVANKLVFSLQFIPSAFVAAIYPAMSKFYQKDLIKMKSILEKSFLYLLFIVLPISLGTIVLAPEIILTLYGKKFFPSILPLRILMVSLIAVFLYFPLGSFLNAAHRQKRNTANMGIAMVINVILNLTLIPYWKLAGAAVASLVSQTIMLFLGLYYAYKIAKFDKFLLSKKFVQYALAAFLMGLSVLWLKKTIYWPLSILFGGLFYFVFLYLTHGFHKQDWQNLWLSLKK